MKLTENGAKAFERLYLNLAGTDAYDKFEPMLKNVERGEVARYLPDGTQAKPTKDQIVRVNKMESIDPAMTVWAIIETTSIMAGEEFVEMHSYLMSTAFEDDLTPWNDHGDYGKYCYAFARVVNLTWNIDELGDIVIECKDDGSIVRIG